MRLSSLLVAVLVLADTAVSAQEIPPVPAMDGSGKFVQDFAAVLYVQDVPRGYHKAIYDAQKTAFEEHDTPIIVVTINTMMTYGHDGEDIQPFAEKWFNKWKIGTLEGPGGHNRGILLLVSVGDRKGRIELGKEWGHRFDKTCQQIMDKVMIPHFKRGDYAAGIAAGTEALGEMAAVGPGGKPTSYGGSTGGIFRFSLFPWWAILLASGVGVGLIYFGARPRRWRDLEGKKYVEATSMTLVYIGTAVIVVAVITPLIVLVLIIYQVLSAKGDRSWGQMLREVEWGGGDSGGGFGGGGFGGGGFGGGSSGGGGASGSW